MTVMSETKLCAKCGLEKPTSAYQKNKARHDGIETYCRECNNARLREKYSKNPQSKIAKTREYHLAHPEWSKKTLRQWHQENKERRYQKVKDRFAVDLEFREYRKEMSRVNGHKRRALKANTEVTPVTKQDYKTILSTYDNKCWICEVNLEQVFWDHVQPLAKGGAHSVDNLRPACNPCNARKNATWPFTDEMKEQIAKDVRALRTQQENSIPVTDGLEVI